MAADLPRRAPPPLVPVPRGFTDSTYGRVTGGDAKGGFAGGGQVGCHVQPTPGSGFVLGVEADIQGTTFAKADAAYLGTLPDRSIRPSLDYFGSVRGRVGDTVDRVLIYGTGSFAYGGGSAAANASADPYALPDTTRTGYAGGGGEYAFTDTLSAKIEALYLNLGKRVSGAAYDDAAYYGAGRNDAGFGLVRAGLNDRFWEASGLPASEPRTPLWPVCTVPRSRSSTHVTHSINLSLRGRLPPSPERESFR